MISDGDAILNFPIPRFNIVSPLLLNSSRSKSSERYMEIVSPTFIARISAFAFCCFNSREKIGGPSRRDDWPYHVYFVSIPITKPRRFGRVSPMETKAVILSEVEGSRGIIFKLPQRDSSRLRMKLRRGRRLRSE